MMQKMAIHSVPRSGSTWLGNIFNSHPDVSFKYQPLFSYAFKDFLTDSSSAKVIQNFFDLIHASEDDFINQKEGIDKGIIPNFEKNSKSTHICYKEVRYHHILENLLSERNEVKVILLVRNPLAVLYSWKNAPKEFRSEKGWQFEEEWLNAPLKNQGRPEEFNGYSKWKEATLLFLNLKERFPEQVFLLTYSQLISDTEKVVKELFSFSNLSIDPQTESFLKESRSKHQKNAYSIFKVKKQDNAWKQLPAEIISFVKKDLKDSSLETFLHEA